MEIIFVTVIGAGLGAIIRYLVPGRSSYGSALLPALGGAVASVVWAALVWLGLTFDGGWIWVAALGASLIAALLAAFLLPRARATADAQLLHTLSHGRA